MYHLPVMPFESIQHLNIVQGGTYVDATYGGGGHSKLILEKLDNGKLIAFDQDTDAISNVIDDPRLVFINKNFRFMANYLGFYKHIPVDGVFADLGVSSHQIDEPSKGFSYMHPHEALDMRMDTSSSLMAADILNTWDEGTLAQLFFKYAELPFSRKLATDIVKYRNNKFFEVAGDLLNVIDRFVRPDKRFGVYSRVFQALRIEVNDEMGALEQLLEQAYAVLKPGGRIVVISYHSIEDRIVKNFFRSGRTDGHIEKDFYGNRKEYFRIVTRKPIVASQEEINNNSRARSAKLRVAEKI